LVDTILDDVKELLKNKKGDIKVLERIKRAAEQGEVISIYERDYVNKLVDQHIKPKFKELPKEPEIETKAELLDETITTTDPAISKIEKTISVPSFEFKSNPKTTKIVFGIGAAALAIILVIGVSFSGISDISPTSTQQDLTISTSASGLVIEIDSSTYSLGDIISISGSTKIGDTVELSIYNNNNKKIWRETIKLKSDGTYSTLTIAGGTGWESSGDYILELIQGSESEEITFTFKK
jgi:hypothetical protein